MGRFLNLVLTTAAFFISLQLTFGQSWMGSYSYRKKITIDKSKVSPVVVRTQSGNTYNDLTDFIVLIELTDPDLVHVPGNCGNKIRDLAGTDIAVASTTTPSNPLNFQMEHYNATTGQLRLWVKIPALSANMSSTAATALYLYYGSAVLHDPQASFARSTWNNDYSRIWHMNAGGLPCRSHEVRTYAPENYLSGSSGMGPGNFTSSLLGSGIQFDGISEKMTAGTENSTMLTVSAWIRLNATGKDQVIISNDTTIGSATNGYTLKINQNDNLEFEIRNGSLAVFNKAGNIKLQKDYWYYVCATSAGNDIGLFVNAVTDLGRSGTLQRLGPGGSIIVGANKMGSSAFKGIIDELKIHKVLRPLAWIQTEYENQKNPSGFYNVSNEEYHPAERSRFTGTVNSSWTIAGNWQNGSVPISNSNILITSGRTLRIDAAQNFDCKGMVLENGAQLQIGGKLKINCKLEIAPAAKISLDNDASLDCGADVINNGLISSNQSYGTLIFSGNQSLQHYRGDGNTGVYRLENNQSMAGNILLMNSPIEVSGQVKLTKGILNSNDKLKLLSTKQQTASLLPVPNTDSATVTGIVHVEKYIDGDYPVPATARGWKLLASPVYHSADQIQKRYTIAALQNAMFVTGPGGISNGFDPSPLNSPTIYSHDQSLPGKLSQKYVPVPDTHTSIPFGKGLCVFSRGDKTAANAYVEQIQKSPFSNPKGYTLTHSGLVHTGDLSVILYNKNEGTEGDGFNLAGNPYPAAITWGDLSKVNLVDFVWLFDPLNNAYVVSDLPETIIPSGSGFFVKVKNRFTSGMLTFTENSKLSTGSVRQSNPLSFIKTSALSPAELNKAVNTLTIELSKGAFRQHCKVKLSAGGNDGVDDHDALKIDEGYVSVGSVINGKVLAINESSLNVNKEVQLHVGGREAGKYQLILSGIENFRGTLVFLFDKYLNQKHKVTSKNEVYEFMIDPAIEETYNGRFSLLFGIDMQSNEGTEDIMVYPNPFKDDLFIKTTADIEYIVTLRDLLGRILIQRRIKKGENVLAGLNKVILEHGIYVLQVSNAFISKYFKILKK